MSKPMQAFQSHCGLSAANIVAAAELQSGLRSTVNPGLMRRLNRLVDWINERGPYSAERLEPMHRQLQHLVATRFRISGDRSRIPAIGEEAIERPIFVVGFGRSGTTLLHSLLAEDPDVHVPRAWHSHSPSPPPGEGVVCRGRYEFTDRKVQRLVDRIPGLLTLHPYWDKYSQALVEDEELFTLDLRNAYPTWLYEIPTLSVMVEIGEESAAETYGFHKQMLQHLQWNTGKRRWAVKGVGDQFLLSALFEAYPDAACIWPHRDPVEVQASMFSIASVLYESINPGGTDWREFANKTIENVCSRLDDVMDSKVVADSRVIHLTFQEVVKQPIEAIRQVYERAGLVVSPYFLDRMHAWLADPENRSDRYGRYPYSYEPFGIDESWLHTRFKRYRERFCKD